jgi:hypothetical protein
MAVVDADGGYTKYWIACEFSHLTPFFFRDIFIWQDDLLITIGMFHFYLMETYIKT